MHRAVWVSPLLALAVGCGASPAPAPKANQPVAEKKAAGDALAVPEGFALVSFSVPGMH